jgi:HEPN domain-containing protein
MIPVADLRKLARARLRDAEVLFQSKRYDGGLYLCGYAVELALKARICRTLKWPAFPETRNEFKEYQSFRTHSLDVLLHLSGVETKVKSRLLSDWSVVVKWDPEGRYRIRTKTGTKAQKNDLKQMIASARRVLKAV